MADENLAYFDVESAKELANRTRFSASETFSFHSLPGPPSPEGTPAYAPFANGAFPLNGTWNLPSIDNIVLTEQPYNMLIQDPSNINVKDMLIGSK